MKSPREPVRVNTKSPWQSPWHTWIAAITQKLELFSELLMSHKVRLSTSINPVLINHIIHEARLQMPVFLNWVLAWCMPIFYYWLTVDIFVNASGKFQKNSSEKFAHNGSTFERIHMYFLKWDYFESYWEVSHIQIVGFSTEAVNPIKSN